MDFQTFSEHLAPFRGMTMILGCSGGLDSMCLLELLLRFKQKTAFQLVVAHVEHGLRGKESEMAAQLVQKTARQHQLPFHQLTIPPGKLGTSNIESVARQARLDFFSRLCSDFYPGAVIVLAHHADDAAETLFLRLERGGNCSSLANLRFDAQIGSLRILRPLLTTTRQQLEQFAEENAIEFIADSTNENTAFERNFLRHDLLPHFYRSGNRVRRGLQASLEALRLDADFLESAAHAALGENIGKRQTPLVLWQTLHPALFPRVLRLYLSNVSGTEWLPNADTITGIRKFFTEKKQEYSFSERFIWKKRGNVAEIVLRESLLPELSEQLWDWRNVPCKHLPDGRILQAQQVSVSSDFSIIDKFTGWFDATLLPSPLLVGPRRNGDVIVAVDNTSRKVKKLLIDAKIPKQQRSNIVVLRTQDTVLLLFGVRQSNFAPITEKTREVVKITLTPQW